MSKSIKALQPPTPEEIALCAYSIYEKEGRPNGRSAQHWLQAEAQLIAERKAKAEEASPKNRGNNSWSAADRARQPSLQRN